MLSRFVLLVCVAVGDCGMSLADEERHDLKDLQGSWEVSELVLDGKKVIDPDQDIGKRPNGFRLVIADDRLSYFMDVNKKQVRIDSTIAINPATKPRAIDAQLLVGVHKGKICQGIYRLDGDTLTICLPDHPATSRPEKFEAPAGSVLHFIKLKRSKS